MDMRNSVLFLLSAVFVSIGAQADTHQPSFTQLLCSGPDGDVVTITGLGSAQLSISGSDENGPIPKSGDGDCQGRKSYCFEDGQWMINVPARLASGVRKTGRVWINGDTDDRPENRRLGDPYDCVAANSK